jgi:Lon protease-like protein
MSEVSWIPLFPLGVVLLPGSSLPLHIFEDRYKTMVGECMEKKEVFGVVYYNGAQIASAGCTAGIVEIRHKYPDGRLDIITRGEKRYYILEKDEHKPYLRGRLRFFDDQPEVLGEPDAELARHGLDLLVELDRLLEIEPELGRMESEGLREVSFRLAGCEGFSLDEKQVFLEMTSTRKRLQKAVPALEKLTDRLKLTLQIRRIIGGNGHPPSVLESRD